MAAIRNLKNFQIANAYILLRRFKNFLIFEIA